LFVSELMTRRNYCVISEHFAAHRLRSAVLAPQPEPASRLRSATRDVSFLRVKVSAKRERPVQRYSEVFGLGEEGQGFVVVLYLTLSSRLASLLLKWSSAYAYFLETVVGRSEMWMLKRRGARTDPCVTTFLRRRDLLLLLFPVVRVNLRLLTISMIM